jgi:pimeloyl-ACP methyl ester carboxylesterase
MRKESRMTIETRLHTISTPHGSLVVEESGQGDVPVLLIHGNSSCRGVFRHQLQGPLARDYRLISFDLPGHGQSSNAPDPQRSYTRPGFADAAITVLGQLNVREAVVCGWSLGGHIGVEMMPRFPGLRGLMIVGTPPIGPNEWARGFIPSPHMGLAARQDLSEAEIDEFAGAIFGQPVPPFLRDAVARADGLARKTMFEASRAGAGVNQRQTVEASPVPLAIVNGGNDPFVNLDYLDTIAYGNLWEGRCHRLPALGHTAFWHAPDIFNPILGRFLHDVGVGQA